MSGNPLFHVRVVAADLITPKVRRIRLARTDGAPLPPYSAGAHVVLAFDTGARMVRNAYSLLGSTLDGEAYEVAVLRATPSRGGSAFLHDDLTVGMELDLTAPVNLFPLDHTGRHHVLVAGGIGITPIAAMAEELARRDATFELHYAMRQAADGAFAAELIRRHGDRVRLYVSERQERISIQHLLLHQKLGTHLYVCGPERMISGVLGDARAAGWPEEALHAEHFLSPAGGEPFDVKLARSGLSARVGSAQTLLEAIEAAGVDVPSLCRGGACGQCATTVLSAEGELIHADHCLSDREKADGHKIMVCVSRLKGRELVLDL